VALRSPNGELQIIRQHDTEVGFRTMLDGLLYDLARVGENDARTLVEMVPVLARRCAGDRCGGAGAPVESGEAPTILLPPVQVPLGANH
jgi:hypothetical protein